MVDIGVITGSGIYELPGGQEPRVVKNRFGETEVTVFRVGRWTVGGISRHGRGHRHLPHTIPHRANLSALKQLGARAILATTAVGVVDSGVALGRPIVFDDLFYPDNFLPDGSPCTVFTEPGELDRGHFIGEPFSPGLRQRMEATVADLGIETVRCGVYGHVNGPRFNTRAEIRWLAAAGVTAVSQTCGPEAVLAGELELPYGLVGFGVNYATGVAEPEPKEELDRLLVLSTEVLPRIVLRAVETLEEEDLAFDHGYVYRAEGGIGWRGS
jgi:purine nucleoside phosphorylase